MRKEVKEKQNQKETTNYFTINQSVSYNSNLKRVRRREPVLSRIRKNKTQKI